MDEIERILNKYVWGYLDIDRKKLSKKIQQSLKKMGYIHVSELPKERPKIVCLCGSTRFSEAFRKANLDFTLKGNIVLSIGCNFKSDDALGLIDNDKQRLDELHLRKIDLADEVFVLDVDGYIGSSTRKEIEYAKKNDKPIKYLSEIKSLNKGKK